MSPAGIPAGEHFATGRRVAVRDLPSKGCTNSWAGTDTGAKSHPDRQRARHRDERPSRLKNRTRALGALRSVRRFVCAWARKARPRRSLQGFVSPLPAGSGETSGRVPHPRGGGRLSGATWQTCTCFLRAMAALRSGISELGSATSITTKPEAPPWAKVTWPWWGIAQRRSKGSGPKPVSRRLRASTGLRRPCSARRKATAFGRKGRAVGHERA